MHYAYKEALDAARLQNLVLGIVIVDAQVAEGSR